MKAKTILVDDLGHKVRSSWESNYCKILVKLGIKYEYEAQSFRLPNGRTYTPDFKLRNNLFVEIKGFMDDSSREAISLFRQSYPKISLVIVDSKRYKILMNHYFPRPKRVLKSARQTPHIFSKTERKFLEDLERGDLSAYSPVYKRQLKHNIIKKRVQLTEDLVLVNKMWKKLQSL